MRLVTYELDDARRAGIVIDEVVVDACDAGHEVGAGPWVESVTGIIQQDRHRREELAAAAAARVAGAVPVSDVVLAAPIADPAKIICIGLNYRAHVEEAKRVDRAPDGASPVPILFAKFATSLIGHEHAIVIPEDSEKLDWEAELAVVIGKRAVRVPFAEALEHVGGYAPFNDVSARDLQLATPQWTTGKAFDTSGPFGPALVTADEVPDPQNLRVMARLNGETMQDASTAEMIFPVARLIEFISTYITLEPGDVIATGTPAGVGVGRTPPVYMRPGDVIEVEIDGLGVLRNPVVARARNDAAASSVAATTTA
jgi:2-keto-4-pentenoate hydratase/2-oxohepta-3-ene-1,7-dioic acid hydratase in catechol pathway